MQADTGHNMAAMRSFLRCFLVPGPSRFTLGSLFFFFSYSGFLGGTARSVASSSFYTRLPVSAPVVDHFLGLKPHPTKCQVPLPSPF